MKILATSDLHGHLNGFMRLVHQHAPEIVVLAGDITDKGWLRWNLANRTLSAIREFCGSHSGIDFVIVPGNHDWGPFANFELLGQLPNVHYFGSDITTVKAVRGIRFFGGSVLDQETLRGLDGPVDIAVSHHKPDAVIPARLVIYGHHHHCHHQTHIDWPQNGETLSLNVSSNVIHDTTAYGCYLIDYCEKGRIVCDWITEQDMRA